jgi:hypothetical protein
MYLKKKKRTLVLQRGKKEGKEREEQLIRINVEELSLDLHDQYCNLIRSPL